ncbi:DUF6461 domain-containing protein [Nonomuraea sp. NPDC050328]|uniref:DUF6461 domain-containing protein n=1 Tax=Nonomuraea sp. NPDC050328 TaxID=3364361 RepID=UPI00378D5E87
MIERAPDHRWLTGDDGGLSHLYVRLPVEEVVARLGGTMAGFAPGTFHGPDRHTGGSGLSIGVAPLRGWTYIQDGGQLAVTGAVLPLSEGTRVVAQYALGIKGLDYFYWAEDGEIRFCFIAQEGYSAPVPEELRETMEAIRRLYPPSADPSTGPTFLLSERLTGFRLVEEELMAAPFLWGTVPDRGYEFAPCPDDAFPWPV